MVDRQAEPSGFPPELGIDRFSIYAQPALYRADAFRRETGMSTMHMEHLVIGILDETAATHHPPPFPESLRQRLAQEFKKINVHVPRAEPYPAEGTKTLPRVSGHVREAFKEAERLASESRSASIETFHLMGGATNVKDCKVIDAFRRLEAEFRGNAPNPERQAVRVYISYARSDEELLRRLQGHLWAVDRNLLILTSDQLIEPVKEWRDSLRKLSDADIAVFLLSPDSLKSKFISQEITQALALHESKDLQIVPVPLKPCDWSRTPLVRFMALPRNGAPVSTWPNHDEALREVAKGIEQMAASILREMSSSKPPTELPTGMERLRMAYLAVLGNPALFQVLETFDETALSSLAGRAQEHPDVSLPPLWTAWMQTVHPAKLGLKSK